MDTIKEEALYKLVNSLSMEFFHIPFQHKVIFNKRLRTTGGRYIPARKTIELNPKYATEMDEKEFVGIIKHELCHYHLHIAGKGYKHGDAEFKRLLKKTNSPRYCTPLPSEMNRHKHIYLCKQCKHEYKRIRIINVKKYRCGKCRGKLYKV
ncbi:SprT family protein [Virgibacillus sp. W0181]|uniref:SprT family protein n=1 Tax=Virgibacillus sp. W0181 TaxID=3391581 RepID=UPI003F446CE6